MMGISNTMQTQKNFESYLALNFESYLAFEIGYTQDLQDQFEMDGSTIARVAVLNKRLEARDKWLAMGREIPNRITFSHD
jgi:hypothetical protein